MSKAPILVLFLAALAVVALPGCVKAKQVLVILPDGSGKMDFRVGINVSAFEGLAETGDEEGGSDDPTNLEIGDLENEYEGFVAFTEPKTETGSDGWKYITFTGYFEDINKVTLYDSDDDTGEKTAKASYTFKAIDGGHVLEVKSKMGDHGAGDMGEIPPEQEEMELARMQSSLEGFEFEQVFCMPGEVLVREGLTDHEGRTAWFKITQKDLTTMDSLRKMGEDRCFKIQSGPSQVSAAEIEAFKVEMAVAKREWAAWQAEAKKVTVEPPPPEEEEEIIEEEEDADEE